MDTERLRQLKRQKELLLGHLDWINQEIDRESTPGTPSPALQFNRLPEASRESQAIEFSVETPGREVESMSAEGIASDLYTELGPDTVGSVNQTKRGCLLLTASALCLFAAMVVAIFLWY